MSDAIAIGLACRTTCEPSASALSSAGFARARDLTPRGSAVAELISATKEVDPELEWFVAAHDGDVDLELIYRFSEWRGPGLLHDLAQVLSQQPGLERVGILIFDLSEPEIVCRPPLPVHEMARTLAAQYEYGGPTGSAFHVFARSVDE